MDVLLQVCAETRSKWMAELFSQCFLSSLAKLLIEYSNSKHWSYFSCTNFVPSCNRLFFTLSTLSISFHIRLMFGDFSRPLKNMLMPFILESHATVLDTFEFLIKVLIKISQLRRLNGFVKLQIMRRWHILRCDKNLSKLPLDIWGYTIYTKNASKHLLTYQL